MPIKDTGVIYYLLETHLNWRIPRFSDLPRVSGSRIWSPKFGYVGECKESDLAPRGWNSWSEPNSNWLKLSLTSEEEEKHVIERIHVGVTNENGKIINICDCIWNCNYKGFDGIRLVEQEEYVLRDKGEIPNGYLRLFCEFYPEYSREVTDATTQTENKKGLDILLKNLKDLYADKETCDVTLKVKDIEYNAHRTILMARSSVFAATFKHDTMEKRTGTIDIPDCDPDSFQNFLEYLYSGEFVDISFRNAKNLYYTSDKYDVQELKTFCVENLIQSVTVNTTCEIADFADMYDETQLSTVIQEFFNKNYRQIFLTSEWEHLLKNNYRLANKLLTQMAKMDPNDSEIKDDDEMKNKLKQHLNSPKQDMSEHENKKRTATTSGFVFGTPATSETNANSFFTGFSMNTPPSFNFEATSTPAGSFQFAASTPGSTKPVSTVNSGPRKIRKAVRVVTRGKD